MRRRIYFHIVWTTRGREPLINLRTAEFLVRHLCHVAQEERARVLEVGIVATHLHVLVTLAPMTQLPRLLQRWKGASVYLANREGLAAPHELRWADGYTAETVSPRQLDRVRAYLRGQSEHHPRDAIPGWHPFSAPEDLR
ncbi:MAG TPA: transposase [Gemmatimonadales bacterium]|nr:transposase [Gemmatimonadales bacterium]